MPLNLRRPPAGRTASTTRTALDSARSRAARRRLAIAAARAALWTILAFVAIRGVSDVLATGDTEGSDRTSADARHVWPDASAQAFAERFARAYLTRSIRYPGSEQRAVDSMVALELRGEVAPITPRRGRAQAVAQTSVARVSRQDDERALITIACVVLGKSVSTRYLTVPVARDARGGLVISDYPSFTSAPPVAGDVSEPEGAPLLGLDGEAIEALLRRFFAAYFGGDPDQLTYFMAPDAPSLVPLTRAYELIELDRVERLAPGRVAATVRVRERATRAVYTLRYRVVLARGDRWLVQELEA